jgi:hypothetical protein
MVTISVTIANYVLAAITMFIVLQIAIISHYYTNDVKAYLEQLIKEVKKPKMSSDGNTA